MKSLLTSAANRALTYLNSIQTRNVAPTEQAIANLKLLDEPLPEQPTDPENILEPLDEVGSPATMDDVESSLAAMRIAAK